MSLSFGRRWSCGIVVAALVLSARTEASAQADVLVSRKSGIKLKLIPAGEFMMGSSKEQDADADDDELPRRRVRITRPFYMGVTEVTVGQFRKVVEFSGYKTEAERDGEGGYGWNEAAEKFESRDPKYNWKVNGFDQTDEHPVVNVTWNDAVAFCNALSRAEGLAEHYRFGAGERSGGVGYRLPTEAEWEYACRAGTTTRYVGGDAPETLADFGNVADASLMEKGGIFASWTTIHGRDGSVFTAPVGHHRANGFGLYDMHGNVWEWCGDVYSKDFYATSPLEDPVGPAEEGARVRVIRGGCWECNPQYARSAERNAVASVYRGLSLGFRLARGPSGG